jgi:uncharacterized UBP type Zn finger protein
MEELVAMGFSVKESMEALKYNNNDLENSLNYLLNEVNLHKNNNVI